MSKHPEHDLLPRLLSDELTPAERDRFEKHAQSCAQCREELENLRRVGKVIAQAFQKVSSAEEAASRIMALPEIRAGLPKRRKVRRMFGIRPWPALAASLLLVCGYLGAKAIQENAQRSRISKVAYGLRSLGPSLESYNVDRGADIDTDGDIDIASHGTTNHNLNIKLAQDIDEFRNAVEPLARTSDTVLSWQLSDPRRGYQAGDSVRPLAESGTNLFRYNYVTQLGIDRTSATSRLLALSRGRRWNDTSSTVFFSAQPANSFYDFGLTADADFPRLTRHPLQWGFIDRKGNIVIKPTYGAVDDFSEGLAVVNVGGKFGFIDRSGKMAIEPQFENAHSFHEGLAAVQSNGAWGAIDTKGEFVVAPAYGFLLDFREGLAAYAVGTRWGYLDRDGKVVTPPIYRNASQFHEGLAAVGVEDGVTSETPEGGGLPNPPVKYGYIDRFGKMIIEPKFEQTRYFSQGLASTTQGSLSGYIDVRGNWAIAPQFYNFAQDEFANDKALVSVDPNGSKLAWINRSGNTLDKPIYSYEHAEYLAEDRRVVGVYNDRDSWPQTIREPFDSSKYSWASEGLVRVSEAPTSATQNGRAKYGFADEKGRIVIEPRFDDVRDFHDGLAAFGVNWMGGSSDASTTNTVTFW